MRVVKKPLNIELDKYFSLKIIKLPHISTI